MDVFLTSIRLAIQDWMHEFNLSICSVLALAGMLCPILVLHGVHNGVISGMKERLMKDPSVLIVVPTGGTYGGFTESFFADVRRLPQTRACIGRTRDVAAEVSFESGGGKTAILSMEPTSYDDPIMERVGVSAPRNEATPAEALLTISASRKLGISSGDIITGSLLRRRDGKIERANFKLKITGIVPSELMNRDVAFVSLNTLLDLQDFRDGFAVSKYSWQGDQPPSERHFESFRVYAKTLDGVEFLDEWFKEKDIPVKTKAREIAGIRNFDNALKSIVIVIASATALGFLAFMFSTAQANVKRKEKMLGTLRLLGFNSFSLIIYPIVQSALTSVLGCAIAGGIYLCVSIAIDSLFAQQVASSAICSIPYLNFFVIVIFTLILSSTASLWSAVVAAKIEPSSVIRDS